MREWSSFAEKNPEIRLIMCGLPKLSQLTESRHYTEAVRILGQYIGKASSEILVQGTRDSIRIAGDANDADSLLNGVLSYFSETGTDTRLSCFWTTGSECDLPQSVIVKSYQEDSSRTESTVIIVKPVINTYDNIRPILAKILSKKNVQKLIVAAPIMVRSAQDELYSCIPAAMGEKVELVCFALDDVESTWTYPIDGILNTTPAIVKERRYSLKVADRPVC